MTDLLLINISWMVVGAISIYYVDKRAYREGMSDAIVMHSTGMLTYTTYTDCSGDPMIEMEIKSDEE